MSGCIASFYGYQRSGKTLMASLIAEFYRKKYGLKVYSNMVVNGWIKLEHLKDFPLDNEPKVLVLDEIYSVFDSREFSSFNSNLSLWITTMGKTNTLFLITAINPNTLEKRIREQSNYVFFAKSEEDHINYRMFDVQRDSHKDYTMQKTEEVFSYVDYNTLYIPEGLDTNMEDYSTRLRAYNKTIMRECDTEFIKQTKNDFRKLNFNRRK